jgi:hypothetical protein
MSDTVQVGLSVPTGTQTTDSDMTAMLAVYRGFQLREVKRINNRIWEFEIDATPEDWAQIEKDLTDPEAGVYLLEFCRAMRIVFAAKSKASHDFYGWKS